MKPGELIAFVRQRDYEFVAELGQGACGRTVLLRDPIIDEVFVCKKYSPHYEELKDELFPSFINEIRILHKIYHRNIVRIFNYFLYPTETVGYILMEQVNGTDIENYLRENPDSINELFRQAIEGFAYLEKRNVLHRDIRPQNVMVAANGVLKIIDFGFGKTVTVNKDYDKSISINWWCDPPDDFEHDLYNHATEVYFLGKLFEKLIQDIKIDSFKHFSVLREMTGRSPSDRSDSFADILNKFLVEKTADIQLTDAQLLAYREFSGIMHYHLSKIETDTKYYDDIDEIIFKLDSAYRKCMLEEEVPDAYLIMRCFLNGGYRYTPHGLAVSTVKNFLDLLKTVPSEMQRIILANLHTKIDSVQRIQGGCSGMDDVPF